MMLLHVFLIVMLVPYDTNGAIDQKREKSIDYCSAYYDLYRDYGEQHLLNVYATNLMSDDDFISQFNEDTISKTLASDSNLAMFRYTNIGNHKIGQKGIDFVSLDVELYLAARSKLNLQNVAMKDVLVKSLDSGGEIRMEYSCDQISQGDDTELVKDKKNLIRVKYYYLEQEGALGKVFLETMILV